MEIMEYKGLEMTNQEDYIFSDTKPYSPQLNLEELRLIQEKLQNFISGKSNNGISPSEAKTFLDWITFNARSFAVKDTPESPITSNMVGQCAPTQRINFKLLSKMGLDVKTFNTGECIGEIPLSQEDVRRVENGWYSPAVRHSVSLVNIPIMDKDGNTNNYKFLLDPTFRQFFLKEKCTYDSFFSRKAGVIAPQVGYFFKADNLLKLGESEEKASKSEALAKELISKGYFYLNEENAKLYGDAFVRASRRIEFQDYPIKMTGEDYIRNFENIPMEVLKTNKDYDEYIRLPSEIKAKKKSIFSRFFEFFRKKFSKNKVLELNEGTSNYKKMEAKNNFIKLREKELEDFRKSEEQILRENNNKNWEESECSSLEENEYYK